MFAEDLAPFFSVGDFATLAVIGGVEVRVIFEQPYSDPFGPALDSAQPQCWAPSASVAHAHQGTPVAIDGNAFKVERVEPDGTGTSRLVLYPTA